ncbi:MBL fold metallo-hydrolase [Bacillus sp. 2205SS5-2]|uniref:MBL fold metallo-hydrolase n=1 Tax=Bacillus sp. 2205SS5-2 TaxID=3109031 RepID=UPI0030051C0E
MNWERIPLGPLQTNCYFLKNQNRECLIFDPGAEGEKLISLINARKYTPLAILLTHAHFDHIGAVDALRDHYSIPVYLHKKEEKWLGDSSLNGSQFFMMGNEVKINPANVFISEEHSLEIGTFQLNIMRTPGHSPGSISFYSKAEEAVISGDALFQGGIGRTDLPGGNHDVLLKSIHSQLLQLPEDTLVLSGHGPETTIRDEMDSNPFLNGF